MKTKFWQIISLGCLLSVFSADLFAQATSAPPAALGYKFKNTQTGSTLTPNGSSGAGYRLHLQSSTFIPAQKSQTIDQTLSILHGVTTFPEIFDLGRDASVLRGFVPIQPRENGILTQRVALKVIVGTVETDLGVAVRKPTGWYMLWSSRDTIPTHATVQLKARAFDGLSWGPWAISDPFIMDNEAPIIASAEAFAEGLMLNSGLGQLNLNWRITDNLPGVSYTIYEVSQPGLEKLNQETLRFWFDANDSDYLTESRSGKVSLFTGKGVRDITFSQRESDHQPTLVIDERTGKSFLRFAAQNFMTATLPELISGSFAMYAVYKPAIGVQKLSLIQFLGANTFAMGVDKPSTFLQTRTGIVDALAPLRSPQLILQVVTYDHTTRRLTTYLNGNVVSERTISPLELNGSIILGNQPGSLAFVGDLAELVIVDNTATVAPDIQNYLGIKWGTRFFDPAAIAGLSLWIDKLLPNATRGAKWIDKANNHQLMQVHDFRSSTVYPLTVDAGDAIDFADRTGVGVMDGRIQNDFTVTMVYKLNESARGGRSLLKFLGEINERVEIFIPTGNTRQVTLQKISRSSNTGINRINLDQQQLSIITFTEDGGKMKLYQNGALISEMDSARNSSSGPTRWKTLLFGEEDSQIGEVLVYDRILSDEERESVEKLLMNKWGGSGQINWKDATSGQGDGSYSEVKADNTYFKYKIVAEDAAGNRSEYMMPGLFTPDRTAPELTGGLSTSAAFDMIRGQEDLDVTVNLLAFQSDNVDAGDKLSWQVQVYLSQGLPTDASFDRNRSAQEVIRSAVIRNGQLLLMVSPNMNTAPPVLGNRFGKENAFIRLTLQDRQGNAQSKDIQVYLDPVNDPPFFKSDVLGELFYRDPDTRAIVYNMKFDEDTLGSIRLADFIDDVDDDINVLDLSVSGNSLFQVGDKPFSSEVEAKFESDLMTFFIGNVASDRELTMQPVSNWYGDHLVDLRLADRQYAVSTPFRIRVWPVNDPPKITSDMPVYMSVDEEEVIAFNVHGFESDTRFEDEVPTFHNRLNWSVVSYDTTRIKSVSVNTLTDVITIVPSANSIGATSIVFRLTDTDTLPIQQFQIHEVYVPNPKSVTIAVTFEWIPINDAPTIGSVPAMRVSEDASTLTFDLSSYKSDIEDSAEDLTWSVDSISSQNLFTATVVGDSLRVTPIGNAWGAGSFRLGLTDSDSAALDLGYTAMPTTSYKTISFEVDSVNDIPSLQSVRLSGAQLQNSIKLLSRDTLTVTALGYRDVGFQANAPVNEIGNEYSPDNALAFRFLKNTPKYNYTYTVKDGDDVIQTLTRTLQTSSQNQLTLGSEFEGKTIEVSITPYDSIDFGSPVTASIGVNLTPPMVSQSSAIPFGDFWAATNNITLGWDNVIDSDGDLVGYKIAMWKVTNWDSPAPNTLTTSPAHVVPFSRELTSPHTLTLPDGHYYWTVYAGNEIEPDTWDYTEPNWLHTFHLDTEAPIVSTADAILFTNLLRSSGRVSDAGKSRVLYGTKPELENESSLYSIIVEAVNTNLSGNVTETHLQLVSTSNREDWTGRLNFPNGTTEYTVKVRDNVGNETTYLSFEVFEDSTPPTAPDLSHFRKLALVEGVYQGLSSANYMVVTGNKQAYTSVSFEGTSLVGFTSQPYFSARIYSDNPAGGLTSRKRTSGNSTTTNIAVTFLLGSPEINDLAQTRKVINSASNPVIAGLSESTRNALSQTRITWSSNRDVSSYAIKNGSSILASGTSVAANIPVSTTILGSASGLTEGDNNLVLEVYDLAKNIATQSISLSRQTARPTTNIITEGSIELVNDRWVVDLNGVLEDGLTHEIHLGGVSQPYSIFGNGTWRYFNNNVDLSRNDIEIFVRDEVYNTANRVLWDSETVLTENDDFIEISDTSRPSIVMPYTSLPANLIGLFDLKLTEDSVGIQSGLSTLSQRRALEFSIEDQSLYIHKGLENHVYQIYAKRFDRSVVEEVDLSDYGIQIAIPYPADQELNDLQPVYFDKTSNTWKSYTGAYDHDAENNRYIITIASTGTFGLAEISSFSENLNQLEVWPNPWVPEDGIAANGTLDGGITFDNLTEGARIRIYTLSGQTVADVVPGLGSWVWSGENRYGHDVASGVYIYLVTDGDHKKRGKLTIIR